MNSPITDVIDNGVCVGCGVCSLATNGKISIELKPHGYYQANAERASENDLAIGSRVCPFSNSAKNENQLASERFGESLHRDPSIGSYRTIHVARVVDEEYLLGSSSGGLTSWVASKLLEQGLVDGIVSMGSGQGRLFEYGISRTVAELMSARKSMYYASTMIDALREIADDGRTYAIVGVPCFIKAARLLADEDARVRSSFRYYLGLVCGHLKSSAFAELEAWQLGISPDKIENVDFRLKNPDAPVGEYSFAARGRDREAFVSAPSRDLVGSNWGHAMFQLKSCDYCDDVFAETADMVFGDAWLDRFDSEWRGTNVVVSRNAELGTILEQGFAAGELWLEELSQDDARRTQAGNFRHRRDGLSVRLADDVRAGRWVPTKRVGPGEVAVSRKREALVRQRRSIAEASHRLFAEAKARRSLGFFLRSISPLVREYRRIDRGYVFAALSSLRDSTRVRAIFARDRMESKRVTSLRRRKK